MWSYRVIIFLSFYLCNTIAIGQEKESKFVFKTMITPLSSINKKAGSIYVRSGQSYNSQTGLYEMEKRYNSYNDRIGFSAIKFNFGISYQIHSKDINKSISISLEPGVGAGEYGAGLLVFESPILLSLNSGLGSTYSSDKDKGFTIGIGGYFGYYPQMVGYSYGGTEIVSSSLVVMPALEFGFRRWTKNYHVREHNFLIGFNYTDFSEYLSEKGAGISFIFSYRLCRFLNY